MQSSRKLGNYVFKAGELVHDAVYFNTLALFKQWYTTYEDENEGIFFRLNTVILTKVKVKSINDVALPDRASYRLRGDAIRLGSVYVYDDLHDEILNIVFENEELNHDNYFWKDI